MTDLDGEVGGVGLTRGGVCKTELLEFSELSTESYKKWSAARLAVSKNDKAAAMLSLLLLFSISGGSICSVAATAVFVLLPEVIVALFNG